jgi:2,3-bisphosphoglycerate-dependent phosphoglycerate mutase
VQLLLIRHAEPVRIAPGEAAGRADPKLTERGRDQSERLADWLAGERIDAVLTSPLRRAAETAAPVGRALGLDVEAVDELMEYDANVDHYIPAEELRATRDDRWTAMVEGRWEDFGGENPERFRARLLPYFDEVVRDHAGGRVAVVCHGGVINVFLAAILGLDRHLWFEPDYTSISRVAAARSGQRSLVTLNETAHLYAKRRPERKDQI